MIKYKAWYPHRRLNIEVAYNSGVFGFGFDIEKYAHKWQLMIRFTWMELLIDWLHK